MAENEITTVQISKDALAMLKVLAEQDLRSATKQNEWLITQEWARRYSRPNPAITVEDAQAALTTAKE